MKRATPCVPKTGRDGTSSVWDTNMNISESISWFKRVKCWFRQLDLRPNKSNINHETNEINQTYLFSSSSFFLGWYFLDIFLCKIKNKKPMTALTCLQYYHTSHTISTVHFTVSASTRYTTSGNPIYIQYIMIYYIFNCAVCNRSALWQDAHTKICTNS